MDSEALLAAVAAEFPGWDLVGAGLADRLLLEHHHARVLDDGDLIIWVHQVLGIETGSGGDGVQGLSEFDDLLLLASTKLEVELFDIGVCEHRAFSFPEYGIQLLRWCLVDDLEVVHLVILEASFWVEDVLA